MDKINKATMFLVLFFVFGFIGLFVHYLFILAFICLVLFFTIGNSGIQDIQNQSKKYFKDILKENNFNPDKSKISFNLLSGIAINEIDKKIAFVSRNTDQELFTFKSFKFKDIIEAKVITNHETLTSTSIGSTVARGIVGGVIGGGFGSLLFGATASKTSSQKIKELTLEFVVDDLLNPRYTLTFYKSEKPLDESSNIIQEIEEWYRTFSVIIKRNEKQLNSKSV